MQNVLSIRSNCTSLFMGKMARNRLKPLIFVKSTMSQLKRSLNILFYLCYFYVTSKRIIDIEFKQSCI
jgi:hypothetical protein